MSFENRIAFLILGLAIGFVVGYIVRSLIEIKTKLANVDKELHPQLKDQGEMKTDLVTKVGLVIVIAVTVWAAIASQLASNNSHTTQDGLKTVTACNQQYLQKTIVALNARTEFSQEQSTANIELQKAQAAFLNNFVVIPPASTKVKGQALTTYFKALTNFVTVSEKTKSTATNNPYPTNADLNECLNKK